MDYASIMAKFPGFIAARSPQDVFYFFDDFIGMSAGLTVEITPWFETVAAGGTITILDGTDGTEAEAGGIVKLLADTNADVVGMQAQGEAFHLADGYPLYFETRAACSDLNDTKAAIGLNQYDLTIYAGGTYGVVFRMDADGVWQCDCINASGTKSVNLGAATTDAQWVRMAFYWDGDDTLSIFYDADDDGDFTCIASLSASTATNYIPQDLMLTPSIENVTCATVTGYTLVDYILAVQQRYPMSGN